MFFILLLAILALPVRSQEETTRDPRALAERLLGFNAEYAFPPPPPAYSTGDTEEFWVTKAEDDHPTKIEATLVAVTRNLYVWVEDGLSFDSDKMAQVAQDLDSTFITLRARAVYGEPTIIPNVGVVPDSTSLIPMPDVDHDPHVFVLYASDLGSQAVITNPNDEMPAVLAPGGYSNQRELLVINTSVLPDAPLDNQTFTTLAAAGFYEFLAQSNVPDQAEWLKEGLGFLVPRLMNLPDVLGDTATAFVQDPNASLIMPSSVSSGPAVNGAQQIFFDYILQRYGFEFFQTLFLQPGAGLKPFDRAFADKEIIDSQTGAVMTGDSLFADFVVANLVSTLFTRPFGDYRYWHFVATLPQNAPMAGLSLDNQLNTALADRTVNQYGTRYIYVTNSQQATFDLNFSGQPMTARLPLPADSDPQNHFYWSGDAADQDTMLTRTFDLSAVDSATLQFDTWYQLDMEHNYGYVEVSTDGGATWKIVPGDLSSEANRYGLAYGSGYTGISNPEPPQPFPILGVLIDTDGMTITQITPDGPASTSDLRVGDVIIGYDGHTWPGQPNVVGLLANYAPGDTLHFYVQRGDQKLDIPVVLGKHPTRLKPQPPIWVSQTVDLSAYAGQEIQVRFEHVSQPGTVDAGWAVDNIAIPEIDFHDDAEGVMGWTLDGWQHIDNRVPQKFLLQYISAGTQDHPPRVRQLIGPTDSVTDGTWHFQIESNEVIIFAISGLTDSTFQPATFTFELSSGA